MNYVAAFLPFAWPIVFLVIALFVLHHVGADLRPLLVVFVKALSNHVQTYATGYGLALIFGLAASLQELAKQAAALHWDYVAAFAAVMQPGLVAIIALLRPSPGPLPAPPPAVPSPSAPVQPTTQTTL